MNRKLSGAVLALLLGFIMAGMVPASELEGTWVGEEVGGDPWTFVFNNTGWSSSNADGDEWYEGTHTVNTSASPKELDLYITDSFFNGYIGETSLAIYKIEGNSVTLTISEPGRTYRPVTFNESGNPRTYTGTKRAEDEDSVDDDNGGLGCFVMTVRH